MPVWNLARFGALGIAATLAALGGLPAQAEPRETLGWGRLFTNDALGDGQDRWRTGSYGVSMLRGPGWDGQPPEAIGRLLEWRLSSEILAPANLATPDPADRTFAGVLTLTATSHSVWAGHDLALTMGLAAIGPQTGLSDFQRAVHDALDIPGPDPANGEIADAFAPVLGFELAHDLPVSRGAVHLRPFLAATSGTEALVRVGADVIIGRFGQDDLILRDTGTGQLYRGISADHSGGAVSLIAGGDLAYVQDSLFLPEGALPARESARQRFRLGLQADFAQGSGVHYGLSWISPEFQGQPEGQLLGSISLNMKF